MWLTLARRLLYFRLTKGTGISPNESYPSQAKNVGMIVVLSPSVGNPDLNRWGSSVVEHVLGKDEVAGSNPVPSSIVVRRNAFADADE